jgi:hypothetical protein
MASRCSRRDVTGITLFACEAASIAIDAAFLCARIASSALLLLRR